MMVRVGHNSMKKLFYFLPILALFAIGATPPTKYVGVFSGDGRAITNVVLKTNGIITISLPAGSLIPSGAVFTNDFQLPAGAGSGLNLWSTGRPMAIIFGTNEQSVGKSTLEAAADSYGYISVIPDHDFSGHPNPNYSEVAVGANHWAHRGKWWQWGGEGDADGYGGTPFVFYNNMTTVTAGNTLGYSMPVIWRTRGYISGSANYRYPGIYSTYVTTTAPKGTYKLCIFSEADEGFGTFPNMANRQEAINVWGGNKNWVEHVTTAGFKNGVDIDGNGANNGAKLTVGVADFIVGAQTHLVELGSIGTYGGDIVVHSSGAYNTEHFRAGANGNYIVNGGLAVGYRGPASDLAGSASLYVNGTITNNGTLGKTDGTSAGAGVVGEVFTALVNVGSAVTLTTGTPANAVQINLGPGDWDVSANLNFVTVVATASSLSGGLTTTSATIPTDGSQVYSAVRTAATSDLDTLTPPRLIVRTSAGSTTVYLVAQATFTGTSVKAFGSLSCRRVR